MKYIRFYGGNGYYSCNYEEYIQCDDDATNDEIDEYSLSLAYDNADSYSYLVEGWDDWFGESEEVREQYYQNAINYAGWEEISEKEYLNHR